TGVQTCALPIWPGGTRALLTRSGATRATRPFFTPETSTGSPCGISGDAFEHHVHGDAAGAQNRPPREVEHRGEEDADGDQHDRSDADFLLVREVHYRPPIRLSAVGTSFARMTAISKSRSRNCCTTGSLDARISSAVPTARIFACASSAIRSATRNAPRTSCVTTTLVTP